MHRAVPEFWMITRQKEEAQMNACSLKALAAAMILAALAALPVFAANERAEGPVADTPKGKVRGISRDGVDIFLGVPAGLPPYEAGTRLREAQPVPAWSGIIDCTKPASLPLQLGQVIREEGKPDRVLPKGGGDCLRVNIWAPAGQASNCPVLVFIPGGGSINCDPYSVDGSAFARDGIVTVTVPYRPNVDGFMKIRDVPANLGLRDMIFDLKWVKDNIAAFGGNPDNVTVMGQSAGSTHIGALLASPLAKGLFRRAILMSGSQLAQWKSPEQADMAAGVIAAFYGVEPTREGIEKLAPEQIVAFRELAARQLKDPGWMHAVNGNGTLFKPYVDGEVLPKRPVEAVAEGASRDVDVLIGSTADEWNYMTVPNGMVDRLGKDDVKFALDSIDAPMSVADAYKANGRGKTDGEIYSAILSDIIFRVPTNAMLEARARAGGKTWAYSFEEKSPAYDGKLGAVHWYDIPYVFKMLDSDNKRVRQYVGANPPRDLADKMHSAWVSFIKTGNPGWRQYDPQKRNVMVIDANTWEEKSDPWKNERELIKLK